MTESPAAEPSPTEAVLTASRALLGIVARSLAPALEMLTLTQFRVLVLLTSGGSLTVTDIAERVGTTEVAMTRILGELHSGGWLTFDPARGTAQLVSQGRALVDEVTERRRSLIASTLAGLDSAEQKEVATAFAGFARAAGEAPVEALLMLGL